MARPPTGQVLARDGARGTVYALRFRAYGKRRYVTTSATNRADAEKELAHTLADVDRGIWKPPVAAPVVEAPLEEPTFWEFAREWLQRRRAEELAAKTVGDLEWSLDKHLIYFGRMRLSEITVQEVDRYKVAKARERADLEQQRAAAIEAGKKFSERGLSNGSINHTLRHLSQILETAVEYGLLDSNPAAGRRRRLKASKPSRPWVEPHQLMAFLGAESGVGRVLLGVLVGTGLRIDEALSLRWRDIDLGTGHLYVRKAKTLKGIRRIPLSASLREELALWRDSTRFSGPGDYVVPTSSGKKQSASNLRRDVLIPAIRKADVELAKLGILPIGHVTFHGLRRSFASLRSYGGKRERQTADLLGHEDVRFTLNVYAQSGLDPDEMLPPVRAAFDQALEWAQMGTSEVLVVPETVEASVS